MKRSQFTEYTHDETIIYEYKDRYYIMELCQQGDLNPIHGTRQLPSDIGHLSSVHAIDAPAEEIGKSVFQALDDFDSRGHPYNKFNLSARGKYIAGLMGSRGLPSLERDSRQIFITRDFEASQLRIYPTDNNNLNKWVDALAPKILPGNSTAEIVGKNVVEAFSKSTWHPGKKN